MKKNLILLFSLLLSVHYGHSQYGKNEGFVYLKTAYSNIFGFAYTFNQVKANNLSTAACDYIRYSASDFVIHNGPSDLYLNNDDFKNSFLTSLFNKKLKVNLSVHAYGVKLHTLRPNFWKYLCIRNYSPVEGLTADSVIVSGKVVDTLTVDGKDALTAISLLTPATTAANIVVNIIQKDSTTNVHLQYKSGRNDTFSFKIADTSAYYAIKFVKPNAEARDVWYVQAHLDDAWIDFSDMVNNQKGENKLIDFNNPKNGQGGPFEVIETFDSSKDDKRPILTTRFTKNGHTDSVVIDYGRVIGDTLVKYDQELYFNDSYNTRMILGIPGPIGRSTTIYSNVIVAYTIFYYPNSKKFHVIGMTTSGNQSVFQNCVYRIRSVIDIYPL